MVQFNYKDGDIMGTTNPAVFDKKTLTLLYNAHKSQFERLVNKQMSIEEVKSFVVSLITQTYGGTVLFKKMPSRNKVSNTMASYSGFSDTFTFDENTLEEIIKDGDLAKLMMLIFHEGTHKIQYVNRMGVKPLYSNIYDTDVIQYILKNISPKEYGNIDPTSPLGVTVQVAAHLSYLREKDETDARDCSYENTSAFLQILSSRTLFFDKPILRQYANDNKERLTGLCKLQDGYEFCEQYGSGLLKNMETWVKKLKMESLARSLVRKKVYANKGLDFSFATMGMRDPEAIEAKKNRIKEFLSTAYPKAIQQWELSDRLHQEEQVETKLMSLLSDEQLLELYECAKNNPLFYNINAFLFESFKTPEAKMKMAKDVIKSKRGDTLIGMYTLSSAIDVEKMDVDELKEMLDTLIENGEYKVAAEFGEVLIKKCREVLTRSNPSKQMIHNANELLNHTIDTITATMNYELHEGILAKEQKRGQYGQMNGIFELASEIALIDTDKERTKKIEALIEEYYDLDMDEDILYDPVSELYKTGDNAEGTLSMEEVEKELGISVDAGDIGIIMNNFFHKVGRIKTEDLTDERMKEELKAAIKARQEEKEFEALMADIDKK